jgi:hypothetical protein
VLLTSALTGQGCKELIIALDALLPNKQKRPAAGVKSDFYPWVAFFLFPQLTLTTKSLSSIASY